MNFLKEYYKNEDNSRIPSELVDIIWSAIVTIQRDPEMVTELEEAVNVNITEWIHQNRHSKKGSSPGMSEVTYDLLKALPEEMLVLLHNILTDFYNNNISPEEWENNWLNIIPKRL